MNKTEQLITPRMYGFLSSFSSDKFGKSVVVLTPNNAKKLLKLPNDE